MTTFLLDQGLPRSTVEILAGRGGAGRGLRLGSDAGVVAGSGFAAVLPEFF
jgi:hypothetical protein